MMPFTFTLCLLQEPVSEEEDKFDGLSGALLHDLVACLLQDTPPGVGEVGS
jgi:hypothetical protein